MAGGNCIAATEDHRLLYNYDKHDNNAQNNDPDDNCKNDDDD